MSTAYFLLFVVSAPFRKLKATSTIRALNNIDSLKDRFTVIYENNIWGSRESVSGRGSTVAYTEAIRGALPVLFEKFKVSSMTDVPCGDFNWMKFVNLTGISYIGGDIVGDLVLDLNRNYSNEFISFIQIDITKEAFPKSDLVLNRDCLFHLSYNDINLTLKNFLSSGSTFFLSTSHDNESEFLNSDIRSGDFRPIDLFASPFLFSSDFHFQIPEPGQGTMPPRKLYLWDREQVASAQAKLENYLK